MSEESVHEPPCKGVSTIKVYGVRQAREIEHCPGCPDVHGGARADPPRFFDSLVDYAEQGIGVTLDRGQLREVVQYIRQLQARPDSGERA